MNPLLLIAGNILPSILDLLAGRRARVVSEAVIGAITTTTGTSNPVAAQTRLAEDPAASAALRVELARIVFEEHRAEAADEAQRRRDEIEAEVKIRRDALDADIARHKARLDEIVAEQKAARDQGELALDNTTGARRLQTDLLDKDPYVARTPMVISYIVTGGFFVVLCLFIFMKNRLETSSPQFTSETLATLRTLDRDQIAALAQPRSDFVVQIINIGIGALAAAFATVVSFWLGSSQSSRNKDVLVADIQERQTKSSLQLVDRFADTVSRIPSPRPTSEEGPDDADGRTVLDPISLSDGGDRSPEPAKPAPKGLLDEVMTELAHPHRQFPGSVSWHLTTGGVAIDGARASGTAGEPRTIRKIWKEFGPLCSASSRKFGVPVELVVATIATESEGDANARRKEPKVGDESVGLMQTLVGTARSALGRPTLVANDLLDPGTSIDAGTAFIASQRGTTHLDPPRVAAAYNAGSLRRDDAAANRWRLHCYPKGTGRHIDRFVAWFNDAMQVSDEED